MLKSMYCNVTPCFIYIYIYIDNKLHKNKFITLLLLFNLHCSKFQLQSDISFTSCPQNLHNLPYITQFWQVMNFVMQKNLQDKKNFAFLHHGAVSSLSINIT